MGGLPSVALSLLTACCLLWTSALAQDPEYCNSTYKMPADCTGDADCDFQSILKWDDTNVMIELRSKNGRDDASPTKLKWLAIGFSVDDQMANTDIMLGWVEEDDTSFGIDDRWASAKAQPLTDVAQGGTDDLTDKGGEYVDGVTVIRATRPRDTGDSSYDVAITTSDPLYVFHVFDGGFVNDVSTGEIAQHPPSADSIHIQDTQTFIALSECVAAADATTLASNATDETIDAGASALTYGLATLFLPALISQFLK